jgi:hypothetical protein
MTPTALHLDENIPGGRASGARGQRPRTVHARQSRPVFMAYGNHTRVIRESDSPFSLLPHPQERRP